MNQTASQFTLRLDSFRTALPTAELKYERVLHPWGTIFLELTRPQVHRVMFSNNLHTDGGHPWNATLVFTSGKNHSQPAAPPPSPTRQNPPQERSMLLCCQIGDIVCACLRNRSKDPQAVPDCCAEICKVGTAAERGPSGSAAGVHVAPGLHEPNCAHLRCCLTFRVHSRAESKASLFHQDAVEFGRRSPENHPQSFSGCHPRWENSGSAE